MTGDAEAPGGTGAPTDISDLTPPDRVSTGARSAEPLDRYRNSIAAMRDTTKWLISVVPGVAIAVTLAGIVPDLADLGGAERDRVVTRLVWAAVAALVAIALAGSIIGAQGRTWKWIVDVYAGEPKVSDTRAARRFKKAVDGSGISQLFGYTSPADYFRGVGQRDEDHVGYALGFGVTLLDFAAFQQVRRRFVWFLIVGTLAAIVAVVALASARFEIADATQDDLPAIEEPTPATLQPNDDGLALLAEMECVLAVDVEVVDAWIVGGSFDDAEIIVVHEACPRLRLRWDTDTLGPLIPAGP